MSKDKSTVSRRSFLSSAAVVGASGALGAGGLLTACSGGSNESQFIPLRPAGTYYVPELTDRAIDGRPLKAALIGCGDRGTGAAFNFISAGDGLSVVACADVFKDRMDASRTRISERFNNVVPDDACFIGFDAYKKAIDVPGIDVVIIASPTVFHPEHVKYAIDQGKHVFCEKPAAIDAVGFRLFMQAVRQAQASGLCIVTGTQRHHQRDYVESYKRVQEGYIGRITGGTEWWNQGHFDFARRRPEWTDMEYMLRDFFSWNWLCGDHVIDQGVHNVDVFCWFSHLKPVNAIGMGSQLRRITGDIFDNFSIDFEFEGGIHVHAMMRQIDNCHGRVAEFIQGTKGSWSSIERAGHVIRDLDGNEIWRYDREAAREQFQNHNAYSLEHIDLVNHIRSGKVINEAETMAIASMACIMGRESAYTGNMYTWDETVMSDLNLMPAELHMGNVDMSKYVAPKQGTSPLWNPPPPPPRTGNRPTT